MNTQLKKGILEMLVLLIVSKEDIYGYELVNQLNTVTQVNEGTIYPILKRLSNDDYFNTYLKESSVGPSRKYYQITDKGRRYCHTLLKEYIQFTKNINVFLKGYEDYEQNELFK